MSATLAPGYAADAGAVPAVVSAAGWSDAEPATNDYQPPPAVECASNRSSAPHPIPPVPGGVKAERPQIQPQEAPRQESTSLVLVRRQEMPPDADERLMRVLDVAVPDADGCLLWPASSSQGYARITVEGVTVTAHRAALDLWIGGLDGLHAGHACHDRAAALGLCEGGSSCKHRRCVAPWHLLPQTPRENIYASALTIASRNAARTCCPAGHPYDDANTYVSKRGCRYCRACNRERERARYHRKKGAPE